MQLAKVQENFVRTILDPSALEGAGASPFGALFQENGIAVSDRLAVYRAHVLNGLAGALCSTFPLIETLAGAAFLSAAARAYIHETPPVEGNLNLYGATFADFLTRYEPARDLPYLPDVARMEWAKNESYFSRDDEALDVQVLQAIPPEEMDDLVLLFRDSVRFVESAYPLPAIRDFCAHQTTESSSEEGGEQKQETMNFDSGASRLLIFRPQLRIFVLELDAPEYLFLQEIAAGQSLGWAAVTVLKSWPNFNLSETLQKHFGLGTFSGFQKAPV
ncbi:MAG: putative DNA-binding domain-containing protein [Alphaproteobacteria bacterium]|nr:putative DNA-binding domain-containing protein [Alphaproteobacteria bacterium]